MYKFNYPQLIPEENPSFTCVVPAGWPLKKLPTMGGIVNYVNTLDQLTACAPIVFEFSDAELKDESSRTVYLDLQSGGSKLFAKPAKIRFQPIAESEGGKEWCVEVALLNHLFGFNAPSALIGNVYLDYAYLQAVMQKSSDYEFRYGIGDNPLDILSGITGPCEPGSAKCAFGMMFCKPENMHLAHLEQAMGVTSELVANDGLVLFGDVGVDQEETLISMLIGH